MIGIENSTSTTSTDREYSEGETTIPSTQKQAEEVNKDWQKKIANLRESINTLEDRSITQVISEALQGDWVNELPNIVQRLLSVLSIILTYTDTSSKAKKNNSN